MYYNIFVSTRIIDPEGHGMPGLQKVNPDHNKKYKKNYGAHKPGMTVQEVSAYYSNWANDYEKVYPINPHLPSGTFHPFFLPVCLNLRGGHQTGFGIQVQKEWGAEG